MIVYLDYYSVKKFCGDRFNSLNSYSKYKWSLIMVDFRNPQELYNALESADMILLKKYLGKLDQFPIIDIPERISRSA